MKLHGLADWFFGYDYFISYAHKDGNRYPNALRDILARSGFKVFLDETGYVPGTDLRRETRRMVKRSRQIIIVGRPSALSSKWVQREVEVALKHNKVPIIIDVNGSVESASSAAAVAELAKESDWLRLVEDIADIDGPPSDHAISELLRKFTYVRQENKRFRIALSAVAILALTSCLAIWQAVDAATQRNNAEQNLTAITENFAGVVLDIAEEINYDAIPPQVVERILDSADRALTRVKEVEPDSIRTLSASIALDSRYGTCYSAMGRAEEAHKKFDRAYEVASRLAEQEPEIFLFDYQRASVLFHKANLLASEGKFNKALDTYDIAKQLEDRWLSVYPDNIELLALQIDLFKNIGDLEFKHLQDGQRSRKSYKAALELVRRWLGIDRNADSRAEFVIVATRVAQHEPRRDSRIKLYDEALGMVEELSGANQLPPEWSNIRSLIAELKQRPQIRTPIEIRDTKN